MLNFPVTNDDRIQIIGNERIGISTNPIDIPSKNPVKKNEKVLI